MRASQSRHKSQMHTALVTARLIQGSDGENSRSASDSVFSPRSNEIALLHSLGSLSIYSLALEVREPSDRCSDAASFTKKDSLALFFRPIHKVCVLYL